MHQYIVNASLQIVPLAQDRHPYEWVDEAISIIETSGLKYEVGAFGTLLEGTYDQVMQVVNLVQEHLYRKGCAEWILQLQLQARADQDMTAGEKTDKYTLVTPKTL